MLGERKSDGSIMGLDDHDLEDRLGFIRKVYGILSVQISFTVAAIAITKLNPSVDAWMKPRSFLALFFFIISFFV